METSCADDTTTVLQENPATGQTERPAELKVSDRFDRCIDLSLQRLVYGTLAGGLAGMIFFSTSEGHESTATPAATGDSPPRNAHISLVLDSPRHARPSICAPAGGMAGSARRKNSVLLCRLGRVDAQLTDVHAHPHAHIVTTSVQGAGRRERRRWRSVPARAPGRHTRTASGRCDIEVFVLRAPTCACILASVHVLVHALLLTRDQHLRSRARRPVR